MEATVIVENVFLDVTAYEAVSFNFGNELFRSLRKHFDSGRLHLVATDITISEVRSRIRKNLDKELSELTKALEKPRERARVLRSSQLPQVAAVLAPLALDTPTVAESLYQALDGLLRDHGAETVDCGDLKAGPIFEKYFSRQAPFGASGEKACEFPDAFVVEALTDWAEKGGNELFVVSGDELFRKACEACDYLHPLKDIAALLDHVASDDEKRASFIKAQVVAHLESIKEQAKTAFQELAFHVDDEWGDVEVEVTSIEVDGEPEILDISGEIATVQVTFKAAFDAHLSYDDSDTGVWDSEDKQMLFMNHVNETVEGDDELIVHVRVLLDGIDPDGFEVEDVTLNEPARGYGIATSKMQGYPWK